MGLQKKNWRWVFFSSTIVLASSPCAINKRKGVMVSRASFPPARTLPYVSCLHSQPLMVGWYAVDLCVLLFQLTLLWESVSAWKDQLLEILLRITAYACSSTSTASYTHLVQAPRQYYMLCREVYQKVSLKQLQTDECI